MTNRIVAGASTLALAAAVLAAAPVPAQAAADIPVVDIAVAGGQATISQPTLRPGVVEFHVGDTFMVPGDNGGPDNVIVVKTDRYDEFIAALTTVFAENPDDPASFAAAAQGMRTVHALATGYGGGTKGTVWQVVLPVGNYYVMSGQAAVLGLVKPVPFTVSGQPRAAAIHPVQAAFWAAGQVGQNQWHFAQLGRQPVEWFSFRNNAHELHFINITGVKPTTTDAMVKKSFASNENPKWVTGPNFAFDVISPGVRVAVKQKIAAGRYLVDCFIPSETDGMPHAFMGMWKLVNVR